MKISLAVNMTINDELFNKKSHWVGKSLKEIHKIIENPIGWVRSLKKFTK